MIGTHCTATVWKVVYSFRRPPTPTTQNYVTGETLLLTADPTGDDLRQVAERFVMGGKPAEQYSDFRIEHSHRIGDVTGLVHVVAPDRGWPTGVDVAAHVLEAEERRQALVHDLANEVAQVTAERDRLRAQLELLQGSGEGPRP